MTTVFPTNNLPTASQPWAREVQKQLSNLIASYDSERINNTARDNQLNSSIIALGGVVTDVTTALTDIGLLQDTVLVDGEPTKINGANIKVGTLSAGQITTGTLDASVVTVSNINASNITSGTITGNFISGGTITGVTFQTAASGTRTVLSGTNAKFYFGSSYVGDIIGDNTWSGLNSIAMRNATATHGFYTDASTAGIHSPNCYIAVGTAATVAGNGVVADFGGLTSNQLTVSGDTQLNNLFYLPGIDASTAAANMRWGTGGPGKVQYSTASSRRFKNSIIPINQDITLDPKKLLDIPVVAFKYNNDYLSSDDIRFNKMIPGFIAEDIEEIYDIAAEKDGIGATDWNPRYVIPGMLALIQELYKRIENLEKGA